MCVSNFSVIIRHPKRMRRIISVLSAVAPVVVTYFSTLSHKQQDFQGKKKLLKINVCFDFLYNFCLNFFCQKELSDILSQLCICLSVKCPVLLSDFN